MQHAVKDYILIVESNDVTRRLLTGILHKKGYETYEASNVDEALVQLGRDVSLMIVDADDGGAAIEGLVYKMWREYQDMPLIVMSENENLAEAQRRFDGPKVLFLGKPVAPEGVLRDVEVALSGRPEKKGTNKSALLLQKEEGNLQEEQAQFMRRAIELSKQKMNENCGGPFGAVVVKGGKIIGEGWNAVTSTNDPTAHAEMMAIRAASAKTGNYHLTGCEIYTSCEPCPMCLAAIYWAHLDRIFYANTRNDAEDIGFDDEFIYRELALNENKRTLPSKMILRNEAITAFEEWERKQDKVAY